MQAISRAKSLYSRDLFLKALIPNSVELAITTEKFQEFESQAIDIDGLRQGYKEVFEGLDYIRGAAAMYQMLTSRMTDDEKDETIKVADLVNGVDFVFGTADLDSKEKIEYGSTFLNSVIDSSENAMERLKYAGETLKGAIESDKIEKWKVAVLAVCYLSFVASTATFPEVLPGMITANEIAHDNAENN